MTDDVNCLNGYGYMVMVIVLYGYGYVIEVRENRMFFVGRWGIVHAGKNVSNMEEGRVKEKRI